MIEVLHAGLLSSLQDRGRIGHAHLGVGRAGAMDQCAWRLANALVGNSENACAIEMTLQGPRLRLHRDSIVALTGAPLPRARCAGQPLPMWRPVACRAGSELDLGSMPKGCRSYLAVAGGIAVKPWLGSCSSDINAGLGPLQGRALRKGDRLPLGHAAVAVPAAGPWSLDPRPWFAHERDRTVLRLVRGSHTPALAADSLTALTSMPFRVDADSNRVGIRLQCEAMLRLREPLELISEGVIAGVMQLPRGGQPIILVGEHPVTGGYPRIAQVVAADLPQLAQCRPGDTLYFTWTTITQAQQALRRQRASLACLCADIARRLENNT